MPDIGPFSPDRIANRNDLRISLPSNIDPQIVAKLQAIASAIDTTTGKFNSGSSGITDTNGRVHGAIASLEAQSSGQMITAFTTHYGPATMSDGKKASTALASATTHLNNIKSVIDEQLPTIQTGMAAYNSAAASESAPANSLTPSDATTLQNQIMQNQINNMCTALGLIAAALPPANSGISGITIGGACATGIQPGGKLPKYDGSLIMTRDANKSGGGISKVKGTGSSGSGGSSTPLMRKVNGKWRFIPGDGWRSAKVPTTVANIINSLLSGGINYAVPTFVVNAFVTPTEGIALGIGGGFMAMVVGSSFDVPELWIVATGASAAFASAGALILHFSGAGAHKGSTPSPSGTVSIMPITSGQYKGEVQVTYNGSTAYMTPAQLQQWLLHHHMVSPIPPSSSQP